ncbi:hypothetical protein BaRGS_00008199 [Batillaria attramentaria]|uniref:Uncharacterized protein n=1 Tax=Batillaria attramentaria TaxID=370345 RepID=A0ABD0LMI0_9CAEN
MLKTLLSMFSRTFLHDSISENRINSADPHLARMLPFDRKLTEFTRNQRKRTNCATELATMATFVARQTIAVSSHDRNADYKLPLTRHVFIPLIPER